MELMELYNKINNPLDDPSVIDKLIQTYAKSSLGGFYGGLVKMVEKKDKGQYYIKDADIFFSMMFNQWKKNVVEMTKERFIELANRGHYGNDFIRMRNYLKKVEDITTEKESKAILNCYQDEDLARAFEKYGWSPLNFGDTWHHVISSYVNVNRYDFPNIEHRLYLNTESFDTLKIAILLVEKMNKHQLPYCFKFDRYGNRDDTVVIYSSSQLLTRYIDVLREIEKENPALIAKFKSPPILTGRVENWIGYGSEPGLTPNGKNQSFNMVRSDIIEEAIDKVTKQWLMNHRTMQINYQAQKISIQDLVAVKSTERMIENMTKKIDSIRRNQTDEYRIELFGYTLADVQSAKFKQSIYNILRSRMDTCLTQVCNGNSNSMQNIEIGVRGGKKILFRPNDLIYVIREMSAGISKNDKKFAADIKTEIIKNSKKYGIDADKFCFDIVTKDNMRILDESKYKKQSSPTTTVSQIQGQALILQKQR
jgi:hypothetical protein